MRWWARHSSRAIVLVGLVFGCNASTSGNSASSAEPDGPCGYTGEFTCGGNTLFLCADAGHEWTALLRCSSDTTCDAEAARCVENGDVVYTGTTSGVGGATAVATSASMTAAVTNTASVTTGAGGSPSGSTARSTTGNTPICDIDTALATCEGSICHGSPGVAPAMTLGAGLDLFAPDRSTALVDRPATYEGVTDEALCPFDDPELIIDSVNPSESLIIKKILGTQSCGSTEPMVGELGGSDANCIVNWVFDVADAAGA